MYQLQYLWHPKQILFNSLRGWSICCATGGQLRALRGVNLKRDEGVSLSVFSNLDHPILKSEEQIQQKLKLSWDGRLKV